MDDGAYGYGGGRRGGYGRGGRGGFQNQNKRKREDYEEEDRRHLLAILMELGDKKQGEQQASVEERVEDMAVGLRRQLRNNREQLCQYVIDCAVELGTKTPTYAMLVGLVNGDDHELVQELVSRVVSDYEAALAAGRRHRARMLLRFMAALVVVNVAQPSEVLTVLEAVVASAVAIAEAGDKTDEGRQWQPYTDYLVYSALMALPWGGSELAAGAADGDDRLGPLFEACEQYMGLRMRQRQPGLAPFSAPLDDDDVAARSDSGSASFLGDVWAAMQEWRDSKAWQPVSVPSLDLQHYEATLAVAGPVELRPPALPERPPLVPDNASPAEVAAEVAAAFPPRGIIKLLPAARTGGDRPALDRIIAEEYILDTIFFFDGNRVDCAGRLAYALPLPYDYDALLAELLFSQMLALPQPQFKPIAYSCLIVDLCKAVKAFPKSMSGCVRELFARMEVMDTELRGRCTEWLAFQLSNFDFVWPWHKWLHVLKAPPHSAQRRFVAAVLDRMVRLSYYDNVIQKTDKGITPLLPPKPEATPLPSKDAEGAAQNGDAANNGSLTERRRAADIIALMKRHVQLKGQPHWEEAANAGVTEWIEEQKLRAELGGVVGVTRAVATGLLVAGAKSFTHMITFVERYGTVLDGLLREAGPPGEEALVDVATSVWASSPQRAAMAVDRLMALRLVSPAAIARWVFSSSGVAAPDDEAGGEVAWDILYAAVDKTAARTQDEADDVAAFSGVMAEKESAARSAADYAARKQREVDEAEKADLPAGVSISDMTNEAANESAAAQQTVAEAQQELERRRSAFTAAQHEQQDLLMQVFSAFKGALSGAAAMDTDGGGDHAENGIGEAGAEAQSRAAWRRLLLGNLRTFARRYFRDAAPLAQRLEEDVFAEGAVNADVRSALLLSFHF